MQTVREREFERSDDSVLVGSEGTALTQSSRAASERRKTVSPLRNLARYRRRLAPFLLLVPALAAVAIDAHRRGSRLASFDGLHLATYLAAVLESLALWASLLYAASRRQGGGSWVATLLFVVAVTFSFGGQAYFYEQYHAYLNVDVSLFASNFMDSIVNQLAADIANYAKAKLPPLVFAIGLVWLGRRVLRPRRRPAQVMIFVAPLVLVASFFIPTQHRHLQASTPDVLYLHAVGGLIRTQLGFTEQSHQLRPRVRNSLPVPKLTPSHSTPRNVLFIILESVRADSACIEYEPGCKKTGYSNELLPARFPLTNMRAVDSSTAISLAVLWSGLGPHEPRDVLHSWPLIFDYAHAAGYDTAFWTSQNMMFGNARLWVKNLGVRKFVSATDLEPTSDLDMGAPEQLLAAHVHKELATLVEPFLAVVQLSNVHYPYLVDPDAPQPFQPATTSKAPDVNGSFKNHYQNAIHQQDRHVASIIATLKTLGAAKRTVIVYTSDHGEAFREHNQMGHTFSVFDEEIRVPAWIDAPEGVLSAAEERNLRAKKGAFVFHVDIAPTILDLMGLWGNRAIAPYTARLIGTSLLAPEVTRRPVPLTNCAGVWSCAFENWGYMQGNMKLAARSWNEGWECYDLASDPEEQTNLGSKACGNLVSAAQQTFGRLPGQD